MEKRVEGHDSSNQATAQMIRIEQGISSKLGKRLPYKSTHYYRALKKIKKDEFDSYLRRRRREVITFGILLLGPLLVLLFLNMPLTGNAVKSAVGESNCSALQILMFALFVGVCIAAVVYYLTTRIKFKK